MKVAIIHYWLINIRGGEKVVEALLELFPQADVYTHVYDPKAVSQLVKGHEVFTSKINKLPFAKKLYQLYMPLMPNALNDFNLQKYDLIISSESGPAKGVIPNPDAYHICYCHSPMRYIWDMYHEYLNKSNFVIRFFMKRMIPCLRIQDVISANTVDCFIANSAYIQKRIKHCYNRASEVIYPPVDIERFLPIVRKPLDYYLFFGQINGYKRPDIAIDACIKANRKLIVAGGGIKKSIIEKYRHNSLIQFRDKISNKEAENLIAGARALLFPGIEDFGIIPVEANAAGCPVIAFRKGGALDTINENITGIFFNEQTADSLAYAIHQFENIEELFTHREQFNNHVKKFSKDVFNEKILEIIEKRQRL